MKLFRRGVMSACALLLLFAHEPAFALQVFSGKVTGIELAYMPSAIRFSLDGGNAACPAGKVLIWQNANVENNKVCTPP